MNFVYRYSTLLICLLFVIASYGQLNSGNLTQYTEKDGLPGVQVSSLLIDRFAPPAVVVDISRVDDFRGLRRERIVSHSQIRRPEDSDYQGGYEAQEGYAAPVRG